MNSFEKFIETFFKLHKERFERKIYEKKRVRRYKLFTGLFIFLTFFIIFLYFLDYVYGIKFTIGFGNSMYPTIKDKSIVFLEKINENNYHQIEIGDIVVFSFFDKHIIHRVIDKCELKASNGDVYTGIITKGDNNSIEDGCIPIFSVVAKYKFHIETK